MDGGVGELTRKRGSGKEERERVESWGYEKRLGSCR
jgi:hypothetical protein